MFLFFAFGIFNFFLNLPEIFGKIAMCGVVGIERIFRGFGILPNKQNAVHFTERVPFSYACYETYHITNQRKDGKEWNRNKNRTKANTYQNGAIR